MGASLGGLVSYNIGMRNPELFSKVAMLSPYLGWGDEMLLQKIVEGEYKEKPCLNAVIHPSTSLQFQ